MRVLRHRRAIGLAVLALGALVLLVFRSCQAPGQRARAQAETGTAAEAASALADDRPEDEDPELRALIDGLGQDLSTLVSRTPGTWGVYIIDLAGRMTIAVHPNRLFPAASTRKLPLVMLVLEQAAAGKLSLDEELVYARADYQTGTGILQSRPFGSRFRVRDLAKLTITHSDNVAARMLTRRVRYAEFLRYLQEVGGDAELRSGLTYDSPRAMANYLEALWSGNRLTPEHREMLLGWLTQTAFPTRLRAGTPEELPVAHKIGTLEHAVHDIGIVMHPSRPYIVVVMSEGAPERKAEAVIARIAELAYRHLAGAAPQAAAE